MTADGVRIVRNSRPGRDWNTCGQAAVATLLAFHRLGPFAGGADLDDAAAIDRVSAAFPPDLPFGLGTSAFRMAAALRRFGLPVERLHSGWFGRGFERVLARVRARTACGDPVPVCVDDGMLGGAPGGAHWAVLTRLAGDEVWLGNAGPAAAIPLERFITAWRCRHLPYTHNHCALVVDP
jgi:hypothetical protein